MVGVADFTVDSLFDLIRGAAPYSELTRPIFQAVLDMLSGRYPSDDFSELRPRLTWDRLTGTLTARRAPNVWPFSTVVPFRSVDCMAFSSQAMTKGVVAVWVNLMKRWFSNRASARFSTGRIILARRRYHPRSRARDPRPGRTRKNAFLARR